MRRHGFTIVELLIVIVVIAVLATVSVVSYNGVRVRSQAAAIAADLKSIEKALNLYKQAVGLGAWLTDADATYFTGTANPSIAAIIGAQPTFREFLPVAPVPTGIGVNYAFDSDPDTYDGCSAITSGVNIYVPNATNNELMQAVDNAMDDGNLSCGRVRIGGTSFHYNIARSYSS